MTEKDWDSDLYDARHGFVFGYGRDLTALLDARGGERILDLGCGTGHLTAEIAAAGAHVTGIDNSPAMLEAARREYPHIDFLLADAAQFSFAQPFDAVFSNAALHWVREPENAAGCIVRALRKGGRFVAEMGGKGNVASLIAALREAAWEIAQAPSNHPWYFPSVGEYASLLERNGLAVQSAALFDRPTELEGEEGLEKWLDMFGAAMLSEVPPSLRGQVVELAAKRLAPHMFRDGRWYADYRRLRVTALKA
jgi:trans-aconitate methyltransferase